MTREQSHQVLPYPIASASPITKPGIGHIGGARTDQGLSEVSAICGCLAIKPGPNDNPLKDHCARKHGAGADIVGRYCLIACPLCRYRLPMAEMRVDRIEVVLSAQPGICEI